MVGVNSGRSRKVGISVLAIVFAFFLAFLSEENADAAKRGGRRPKGKQVKAAKAKRGGGGRVARGGGGRRGRGGRGRGGAVQDQFVFDDSAFAQNRFVPFRLGNGAFASTFVDVGGRPVLLRSGSIDPNTGISVGNIGLGDQIAVDRQGSPLPMTSRGNLLDAQVSAEVNRARNGNNDNFN